MVSKSVSVHSSVAARSQSPGFKPQHCLLGAGWLGAQQVTPQNLCFCRLGIIMAVVGLARGFSCQLNIWGLRLSPTGREAHGHGR